MGSGPAALPAVLANLAVGATASLRHRVTVDRSTILFTQVPCDGEGPLAEARRVLRTPPPGTTPSPDKTLRPPPSCPAHPVRVVASFESEVVFPVGTESFVTANQIVTTIPRRNSTTNTDNTAADTDTHDHTDGD